MTLFAEAPAHLEPVRSRDHLVENDGVHRQLGDGPRRVLTGSNNVDRVALALPPPAQQARHLHIVLDDEHPHSPNVATGLVRAR